MKSRTIAHPNLGFITPLGLPFRSAPSSLTCLPRLLPRPPCVACHCEKCQKNKEHANSPSLPILLSTSNSNDEKSNSSKPSRQSFIKWGALALLAFITEQPQRTVAAQKIDTEKICDNCRGKGEIKCELCLGTGFWRAISGSDPKQKYKGVVCPECEGSGILTCPVCLGTGEGDVRGLLRRRQVAPGRGRVLQS